MGKIEPPGDKRTEQEIRDFLTGPSVSPGAGINKVGVAGTYGMNTDQWAVEFGTFSPQIGVNFHYTWELPWDTANRW